MVAAAILNIEKSQYLRYAWTNFNKIWHGDVSRFSRLPQPIKFYGFKNLT